VRASARVPRRRSSSSLASHWGDPELRRDRGACGSGGIGGQGAPATAWGCLGGCGDDGDASEGLGVHGMEWPAREGLRSGGRGYCCGRGRYDNGEGRNQKDFFFALFRRPFL
jgi:hypothetical protein